MAAYTRVGARISIAPNRAQFARIAELRHGAGSATGWETEIVCYDCSLPSDRIASAFKAPMNCRSIRALCRSQQGNLGWHSRLHLDCVADERVAQLPGKLPKFWLRPTGNGADVGQQRLRSRCRQFNRRHRQLEVGSPVTGNASREVALIRRTTRISMPGCWNCAICS